MKQLTKNTALISTMAALTRTQNHVCDIMISQIRAVPVKMDEHNCLVVFPTHFNPDKSLLRCYLKQNVAMFMKNSIFLKIQDLRWLKTVSSTFQDVEFDGSLLPLFIN